MVAWLDYRKAMEAWQKRDYAKASLHMSRAAEAVPSTEYRDLAHYLRGLLFYHRQQDAAAVKELAQVTSQLRQDLDFQRIHHSARVNEAWEAKDYVAYLARAEELHARWPDDPEGVMSVAAGNAYRYAQTGDEQFRRRSEQYLARLEGMEHELDEPMARIRRCLETRVIQRH